MKTAKKIGEQQWLFNRAQIYELSETLPYPPQYDFLDDLNEPIQGYTRHLIVSVGVGVDTGIPEAMSFACDERGEFVPEGSRCSMSQATGSLNHEDAITILGFEILHEVDL